MAMTDVLDGVRDHYRATGLTDRLKTALIALGPENQRLMPQQLAALDQFHTRGLAATTELGKLAGVTAGMSVLDVGAGVGGPARFLAATCGCQVTGIDLSEPFVDAARYRRVLKLSGRFAIYDVVLNCGDPHYPVPWARTPATSFLLTAAATRAAIEPAGFRMLAWQDDTEAANAWFAQLRASGPPPSPNLGVVMGPDFVQLSANLGRNLMEGRLGILTAVFEAASRRMEG
jgi:SAM-dependent methyltransferase